MTLSLQFVCHACKIKTCRVIHAPLVRMETFPGQACGLKRKLDSRTVDVDVFKVRTSRIQRTCHNDPQSLPPRAERARHKRVVRTTTSPLPSAVFRTLTTHSCSWDSAYTVELANHTAATPHSPDEGTIWFSDADAEAKVIEYLETLSDELVLVKGHDAAAVAEEEEEEDGGGGGGRRRATTFLDLGTGNGHMLFALRQEGWLGEMVGVDYSAKSVELCRRILERRRRDDSDDRDGTERVTLDKMRFEEYDVLGQPVALPACMPSSGFDVVLDKGTFDAISLSAETDVEGRRVSEGYPQRVESLVRAGGLAVVTSCNWTADEVRGWFERAGGRFKYRDEVRYPSFTFGGKSGSKVCSVCFEKS